MVRHYKKRPRRKSYKKKPAYSASVNLGSWGQFSGSIGKRSFQTRVRRAIEKDDQPQHYILADASNNTALTHNTIYTWNLCNAITYGTTAVSSTEWSRTGDVIHLDSMKIASIVNTSGATLNSYTYRLMVISSDTYYNLTTWGSGFGLSDLFVGSTGNSVSPCGIIDPRKVTILYDQEFTIQSKVAATAASKCIKTPIVFNRKFEYVPGVVQAKNKNLYAVFIPYVIGGTTGVTACGTILTNSDMIFKNCR